MICVNCKYSHVNRVATKTLTQQQCAEPLRDFQERKQSTKEEATKTNTAAKRINASKAPQPHRQCHCVQMFVSVLEATFDPLVASNSSNQMAHHVAQRVTEAVLAPFASAVVSWGLLWMQRSMCT